MNPAETIKDGKVDPSDQCCRHIYHVYHIDHVEHIHHIYPPTINPSEGKPETIKTPVERTVLAAVSSFGSVEGLSALLPLVNNSITITSGTLPGGVIGDVLHAFNSGNPLEIVKVVKSVKADGVTLSGTTSFMGENNVAISAAFQPDGDFTLNVDFPSSSLAKFLGASESLNLPRDFDVPLPETWAIISSKDKIPTIVAAAKGSIGEVSIQGTKEATGWEFTAGIDLAASNLSSISVLKPLAAFDDFVGLTDIVMILSSRAAPDFDFPDTDQFGVPALSWGKIKLPDDAGGLVKGLNLYANLSTAKSKPFRLLANFLKIKLDGSVTIELSVSLPDPEQSSKLFVSFTENDVLKGLSMSGTVGGVLQEGQVGAELTASSTASIQSQPVVFEVNAVAVETGMYITGDMQDSGEPIKFTIEGIHFSIADIGLLIGIDDAGIPSLGFTATIDIGRFNASAALFLDSVQPEQSMFAAAISSLSLFDVASSIAGQKNIPGALENVLKKIGLEELHAFTVANTAAKPLITALDNRDLPTIADFFNQYGDVTIPNTSDQILLDVKIKSSLWYLTDLSEMIHYALNVGADGSVTVSLEPQFYCCPQPTQIGSFTYPQGFHVYAKIDYFFIAASVKIEAQGLTGANTGISAVVTLDKIIIGHSQFISITDASGQTGPQFSMATYAQGSQEPHISISGAMKVLGLSLPSIYLDITETGVNFDLTYPASNPYFTLQGTIGDTDNMHLDGEIDVSVHTTLDLGELGKVPFDADVKGNLDLEVNKGNPSASVDAEFELKGCGQLQTGKIDLDFKTDTLDNLPNLAKKLVPYIEQAVVKALKSDANKWADMIKDGAIQDIKGADQIAGVLNSEYKLSASDASKILSRAGCAVDDISNALKNEYKLSSELTAATLNQALGVSEQEANKVAGVVNSVDHVVAHTEQTIDHGVDHAADKIGRAFRHIRLEANIAPTPSETPTAPALARNTNPLKVPYCDQQLSVVANGQHWRKDFSGSSAMLAMYWGKEPNDNVYDKLRARYGDSTNSDAQLGALRSLGLTANFETDGTVAMLKQEIDAGRPVAVGWLCDGPVSAPSGGGHWIVVIGYDDTGFFVNDPYGNCDLINGGYLSHDDGAGLHYSYQNWVPRWRVDGTGGWMLTCRS